MSLQKRIFSLLTVMFISSLSLAQPPCGVPPCGNGNGNGGGPGCFPPPCVPIDNGIYFLVAAGIFYGAKKIKVTEPRQ